MMTESETSDLPTSLLSRLTLHATRTPTKQAIAFLTGGPSFGGTIERTMTYRDIERETNQISDLLLNKGLSKGDRAVLVYPPSLDFMMAFLACLKAGIVAVPVFPPHPGRKDTLMMFSRIVEGCGAKYALTSVSYNHMKKLANIKDTFTFTKKANISWPEQLQWITTNNNISTPNNKPKPSSALISPTTTTNPSPTSLAFLQYTSGSTSEPKGVMITHQNLSHNLTIIVDELEAMEDTIVVSWLPQYHDMGLIGSYLGNLYVGGSGYYMSPLTFLQRPMVWIEAISKFRATHVQVPNFALKLTARKFDPGDYGSGKQKSPLDLSSLRHVINGAEPIDEGSLMAFKNAFGPFGLKEHVIFPTYGLAEHTVFVCSGGRQILTVSKHDLEVEGVVTIAKDDGSMKKGGDAVTTRIIGCGYPSRQGVDVRIVDVELLRDIGDDTVGEIWIRSPSKAVGYYNKPELTQSEFRARLASETTNDDDDDDDGEEENADPDDDPSIGYLRSGDLGFLHQNELFICGRLKDLIIVGGRNHYPQDIEATAEAVTDALRPGCSAAFSVQPSGGDGKEQVVLLMELRDVPKSKDVESICKPLVDKVQSAIKHEHSLGISHFLILRPRTVPKTTSGKIARTWCRKAYLNHTLQILYQKSLEETTDATTTAEDETNPNIKPLEIQSSTTPQQQPNQIRSMEPSEIASKLVTDIARLSQGTLQPSEIAKDVPLTTMLDSMTISQFKGMLELEYATKISDDYLFLETTNVNKLVEVVKLGYAPDDDDGAGQGGSGGTAVPSSNVATSPRNRGLAGAMGCPPGIVCCVVM